MVAPSQRNRRRSVRYLLNLNEEEKALLQRLADESGESMGELIRMLLIVEDRKRAKAAQLEGEER